MRAQKHSPNEWVERIRHLLADLKLSQAALAERLGISPPTVSRWLQGHHEPTAESYVALGNLARPPEGIYFWERAGLDATGLIETGLLNNLTSIRVNLHDIQVVEGRKVRAIDKDKKKNAVAIPLLNATAYGDRIPPHENVSLSQVEVEDILFAPLSWCPHPENMIGMHLEGDSMMPAITPGSILFVDTASKDRDHMRQRIAVVSHRDLGFKVARFQRISGSDFLVSANYKYAPVDVSNASKWKIFGEVLWWVSREGQEPASHPIPAPKDS
ncbi:MAG TPA: XRE family transcriptional regulator [Terracidiphilus sp.]|nr:XRE family transcriptional regulator [Terracidiphilus sp.]